MLQLLKRWKLSQISKQWKQYKWIIIISILALTVVGTSLLLLQLQSKVANIKAQKEEVTQLGEQSLHDNEIQSNETTIEDKHREKTDEKGKRKNTPYEVGMAVQATAFANQQEIQYVGKVINSYAEAGTVLLVRGNRDDGIWEFSYRYVLDIHASLRDDGYDETNKKYKTAKTDETIRAVMTTENELIFLRQLNEQRTNKKNYKIIDIVKKPETVFHHIDDTRCVKLPRYVYDFLIEQNKIYMCEKQSEYFSDDERDDGGNWTDEDAWVEENE